MSPVLCDYCDEPIRDEDPEHTYDGMHFHPECCIYTPCFESRPDDGWPFQGEIRAE